MDETPTTYECPHHKTTQARGECCSACVDGFDTRRKADEMTGEDRRAEMLRMGIMTMPFDKIHQRIEELVGRPVWTHEMGLNWAGLVEEAASRKAPTMQEIIDLVPPEKLIVVTR